MTRKFNNGTNINEDFAIQLAGKERHHGQSVFSVLHVYREIEENQLLLNIFLITGTIFQCQFIKYKKCNDKIYLLIQIINYLVKLVGT